jgi:DUF438 domain-containing protein
MAGLEDVPMSDEAKSALMNREAKLAMEEIVEEIKPALAQITEAVAEFEADPAEDKAPVHLIMITLVADTMNRQIMTAARRFQRRSKLGT